MSLRDRRCCIHHDVALGRVAGEQEKSLSDSFMERRWFIVKAVSVASPFQASGDGAVEHYGTGWPESAANQFVETRYEFDVEPPRESLIDNGRCREAIAKNDLASLQCRADHLMQMLRTVREVQQELGHWCRRRLAEMHCQTSDLDSESTASGLSRDPYDASGRTERLRKQLDLGRLAGTFYSLECDERALMLHGFLRIERRILVYLVLHFKHLKRITNSTDLLPAQYLRRRPQGGGKFNHRAHCSGNISRSDGATDQFYLPIAQVANSNLELVVASRKFVCMSGREWEPTVISRSVHSIGARVECGGVDATGERLQGEGYTAFGAIECLALVPGIASDQRFQLGLQLDLRRQRQHECNQRQGTDESNAPLPLRLHRALRTWTLVPATTAPLTDSNVTSIRLAAARCVALRTDAAVPISVPNASK